MQMIARSALDHKQRSRQHFPAPVGRSFTGPAIASYETKRCTPPASFNLNSI
jgi:hypothetical protein